MSAVAALVLYASLAVGLGVTLLLLAALIGPRRPRAGKAAPYECGVPELAETRQPFSVKFYVVAVLFILFDVELAFLLPWATVMRSLGIVGLIEMLAFLGVVVLGLMYAWRRGGLTWEGSTLADRRRRVPPSGAASPATAAPADADAPLSSGALAAPLPTP